MFYKLVAAVLLIFSITVACCDGRTTVREYITLPSPEPSEPEKVLTVWITGAPTQMRVGQVSATLFANTSFKGYDDENTWVSFEWRAFADCGTITDPGINNTRFIADSTPGRCTIILTATDGEFITFNSVIIRITE